MRRHLAPVLVALASAAVVGLLAFGLLAGGGSGGGAVGSTPASGPLLTLDGSTKRTLAAFRGRPVVLNVFASWCGPCKDEAPVLRRAAARGARIVGITYADAASDAQSFVKRFRLAYPILRGGDDSFANSLGVKGVPETFVLNARGKIIAVSRGEIDDAFLQRALGRE